MSGPVPLTAIQEWFFDGQAMHANHFNQAVLLQVLQPFETTSLRQAVREVVAHHSALRLRFGRGAQGWFQQSVASDPDVFSIVDMRDVPEPWKAFEPLAAQIQSSLDIVEGPIVRIVLFDRGTSESARLLVVIHHLAVDGVSWRILLEDLQRVWEQLRKGQVVDLGAKTIEYADWALRVRRFVASGALNHELSYWQEQTCHSTRDAGSPRSGSNTAGSARTVTVSLDPVQTTVLLGRGSMVQNYLLTALALALVDSTGDRRCRIDVEGHGRETVIPGSDISRTVGWFTSVYPLSLDLGSGAFSPADALIRVAHQLRRIPSNGFGYGPLRYLSSAGAQFAGQPPADICFNYLGQTAGVLDRCGPFRRVEEPIGFLQHPDTVRRYLVEVNVIVEDGCLRADWIYGEACHKRAEILRLANGFVSALILLLASPMENQGGRELPDFAAAGLSQRDFEGLVSELHGEDE